MFQSISLSVGIFVLSIAILVGYQISNGAFDIQNIKELVYENNIILLFTLTVSSISLYFYNSDESYKKKSKNKLSITAFKLIAKIIHISTIIIVVDSILIDNFLNLEFHDNIIYTYIGISIASIAIALFISSKISLGKNYSPCYDQRTPRGVTSSGLYKYIRHPMYSSNILLLIGTFIISGSYLMLGNIFLLSFFYIVSAYREEKYLINKFTYYNSYSKKTGMFIPKYRK